MATFLDIGLFSYFSVIFSFLLVFVVVFGLLEYIKIFGSENKGWHAIIALSIAALTLMSGLALKFLTFVTPWFLMFFFVIFFIIFAVRMFGVGEKDMIGVIKDSSTWPWILVFSIIIVLFGLGNAIGQTALEQGPGQAVVQGSGTSGTGTIDTTGTNSDSAASAGTSTTTTGTAAGTGSTATSSYSTNVYNTIFHPKVLGLIFMLLIATISIAFLAKAPSAD